MSHISICRIGPERWSALLDFYRQHPGATNRAAVEVKINKKTTFRCWHEGYDEPVWAKTPMKEIIEKEQVEARALLEAQERERLATETATVESLSRIDAVKERAREAQGVRGAMSVGLTALASGLHFQDIQVALGKFVADTVTQQAMAGDIEWDTAVEVLGMIATYQQKTLALLREAMLMQRLHLGENKNLAGDLPNKPPLAVETRAGEEASPESRAATAAVVASPIPNIETEELLRYFGGDRERMRKALAAVIAREATEDAAIIIDLAAARSARSARGDG